MHTMAFNQSFALISGFPLAHFLSGAQKSVQNKNKVDAL